MTEQEIDYLYRSLGEQIRAKRTESGLSQESLASILGLSRASIVNIEKGRQRTSLHLLLDIAHLFDTNIQKLLPSDQDDDQTLKTDWQEKIKNSTKDDKDSRDKLINFLDNLESNSPK